MREKIAVLISFIAVLVIIFTWPSSQNVSEKSFNMEAKVVSVQQPNFLRAQLSHLDKTPQSMTVTTVNSSSSKPSTSTTTFSATSSSSTSSDETNLYVAWTRVAVCEEGGWGNYGFPAYPNSLGINATNWYAAGGTSDLSISAQIAVAEKFRAQYAMGIPDQNGCAAW